MFSSATMVCHYTSNYRPGMHTAAFSVRRNMKKDRRQKGRKVDLSVFGSSLYNSSLYFDHQSGTDFPLRTSVEVAYPVHEHKCAQQHRRPVYDQKSACTNCKVLDFYRLTCLTTHERAYIYMVGDHLRFHLHVRRSDQF